MKCKICNKKSITRKGFWTTISDTIYPLCDRHMNEYLYVKERAYF